MNFNTFFRIVKFKKYVTRKKIYFIFFSHICGTLLCHAPLIIPDYMAINIRPILINILQHIINLQSTSLSSTV